MIKKKILYLIGIIAILLIIILSTKQVDKINEDDAYELVNNFLVSIQNNEVENALKKVHFEEKRKDILYTDTKKGFENDVLIGYTINSIKKLSNKLYRFDIILDNTYNTHFKPFIFKLDGELMIALNKDDLPLELIKNIDIEENPNEVKFYELIN